MFATTIGPTGLVPGYVDFLPLQWFKFGCDLLKLYIIFPCCPLL
jgi:hypothetical protein